MTLQSSPGWVRERIGFATASRTKDVLDYTKAGNESAKRRGYKIDVVTERVFDRATDHYVNAAMQRGLDEEPNAREKYEAKRGCILLPARFVIHPRIQFFGATPDGFVDDDGLAEFKVPQPNTFVEWVLGDGIPEEHIPQLDAQLSCTGRKWVDFVAYSPEGDRVWIRRRERDEEAIANIEAAVQAFLGEVDKEFERYVGLA